MQCKFCSESQYGATSTDVSGALKRPSVAVCSLLSKSALITLDVVQLTKRLQDGDYSPVLWSSCSLNSRTEWKFRPVTNALDAASVQSIQSCPMEKFLSTYCTVYSRESIGDLSRKSCGCLYNTSETSPRLPWSTFNSCDGCEKVIRAHLCYQNSSCAPVFGI